MRTAGSEGEGTRDEGIKLTVPDLVVPRWVDLFLRKARTKCDQRKPLPTKFKNLSMCMLHEWDKAIDTVL